CDPVDPDRRTTPLRGISLNANEHEVVRSWRSIATARCDMDCSCKPVIVVRRSDWVRRRDLGESPRWTVVSYVVSIPVAGEDERQQLSIRISLPKGSHRNKLPLVIQGLERGYMLWLLQV